MPLCLRDGQEWSEKLVELPIVLVQHAPDLTTSRGGVKSKEGDARHSLHTSW
jgi:hypothetical protein